MARLPRSGETVRYLAHFVFVRLGPNHLIDNQEERRVYWQRKPIQMKKTVLLDEVEDAKVIPPMARKPEGNCALP